MNPSLSIIVPVFNEERTILQLLETVFQKVPDVFEVIVVDDGSTDRTREIVTAYVNNNPLVRLIRHPKNLGKTAGLRTGFRESKGDIVIVQDSDMEYDPEDIPSVIQPIQEGKADVVYGSRFMVRRAARVLYFRHYLANRLLTFCSNLMTDLNMTDVETGYKAFRGDIIRQMNIVSSGFGFEIEVTAKASKLKYRIYEVPISYHGRTYEEGKKIGFKDALMAMFYIFRFNLFK
jgi:glycosyltransferase involved in cell wall biosynthesis